MATVYPFPRRAQQGMEDEPTLDDLRTFLVDGEFCNWLMDVIVDHLASEAAVVPHEHLRKQLAAHLEAALRNAATVLMLDDADYDDYRVYTRALWNALHRKGHRCG